MKAKKITEKELIQAIVDSNKPNSAERYAFFLGAGASVQSGIKLAKELAENWIETIEKISPTKINPEWKSNPAKYYSEVFDARFAVNRALGNNELQEMITNAKPSIGYLLLAQILAKTNNKFVLTTNFDTMTEDALFLIKNVKPFVIGHNSLAHLLTTSNPSRPIIAKLHNDFLLGPKSSSKELISLPAEF